VSVLVEGQCMTLTQLAQHISSALSGSSSSGGEASAAEGQADAPAAAAGGSSEVAVTALAVRNIIQDVASRKSYGLQDGRCYRLCDQPPRATEGSCDSMHVVMYSSCYIGMLCHSTWLGHRRSWLSLSPHVLASLLLCLSGLHNLHLFGDCCSGLLANVDALEDDAEVYHWCWELRTFAGLPKPVKQAADAARKRRKQVRVLLNAGVWKGIPHIGAPCKKTHKCYIHSVHGGQQLCTVLKQRCARVYDHWRAHLFEVTAALPQSQLACATQNTRCV
jgi:hypothetical protein